jgi:hypothetical protein
MKYSLILIGFFLSINFTSRAQENIDESTNWETKDLRFQFDYIYQKSTNYQEYKVVPKDWLLGFKLRMTDSIFLYDKSLLLLKEKSTSQTAEILDLNLKINALRSDLEKANINKESIVLLGVTITKTQYSLIVWIIIAGLLLLIFFGFFKYKRFVTLVESANASLKIVEEDFDNYRRIAIEREQKVRRQLQDEILKQKKGSI